MAKYLIDCDDSSLVKGLMGNSHVTSIVEVDRHSPGLSSKEDVLTPEFVFSNDSICLAFDGVIVGGQRDLKINSCVNEVLNFDVNIIIQKGAFDKLVNND